MLGAFGTWGGWAFLTAVGTFGAVVVAVGLQWWLGHREKASRPQLTLRFDEHRYVQETNPYDNLVPYLRLAVTNAAGKRTAEHVEVLIERIEEYAVSSIGSGGRIVWLANPALGWANSLDSMRRACQSLPVRPATSMLAAGPIVKAPSNSGYPSSPRPAAAATSSRPVAGGYASR